MSSGAIQTLQGYGSSFLAKFYDKLNDSRQYIEDTLPENRLGGCVRYALDLTNVTKDNYTITKIVKFVAAVALNLILLPSAWVCSKASSISSAAIRSVKNTLGMTDKANLPKGPSSNKGLEDSDVDSEEEV